MERDSPPAASGIARKDSAKPEGVTKRTKSRNGCRECKAKRLKCDETKPECLQCTKRGKECPGYVKDFRFSAKHERLHSISQPSKRVAKASSSVLHSAAQSRYQTSQTQQAPPVASQCNDGGASDSTRRLNLTSVLLDSQSSVDAASPEAASPGTSTPRSGYLSWAEVLSPAPTVDEDDGNECNVQAQQYPSPGISPDHDKVSHGPASPVSLLDSPEAKSRSVVPAHRNSTGSQILYTPVDLPSTLIEYWFSNVSPMWSAYDGPSNPNRQLALSNHSNSESVFYALQSMAAAHRVDSLPHLKPILTSSLANAMAAIRRELDIHYDRMPNVRPQLPVDVLLAMFAMATSLCWTDTSQLGEQLVVGARALLDMYGVNESSMSESDRKHLQHFRHALIYMEMLHNFVNPNGGASLKHLRRRRRSSVDSKSTAGPATRLRDTVNAPEPSCLHPWTGVSSEIQEKFGFVMALCRENLRNIRISHEDEIEDEDARSDLDLARELAQELSDVSFDEKSARFGHSSEHTGTGDDRTPVSHLVDTAEAYRLSALLQLHITFDELDLPDAQTPPGANEKTSRDSALLALALEIVNTLQRIPVESGTKCIQPVLYISAATGLKFDLPVTAPNPDLTVTECTVQVSRARQFIIDRLATLQRSLPPRPITVALRLVKAVWEEYDYGGTRHWTDVMREDPGLQTLFG